MEDRAETWFRQRTTHWHDWPLEQLMRWKDSRGARISVVIPARDEVRRSATSSGRSPQRS
jgi:hypothetical protein